MGLAAGCDGRVMVGGAGGRRVLAWAEITVMFQAVNASRGATPPSWRRRPWQGGGFASLPPPLGPAHPDRPDALR